MATKMNILSPARKTVFEDVPRLSREEGISYTTQDAKTRKITSAMRSDVNKVGFLMQRAYFQAKGRFFPVTKFKPVHKKMAERSLGLSKPVDLAAYDRKAVSQHRLAILNMYGWKGYEPSDRKDLEEHALLCVDKQKTSEDVLFSLLAFCWKHKIEVPGYNEFVDIVSQSFDQFEETMRERIEDAITEEQQAALIALIDSPEIASKFSELKRIDQATTQKKLNNNAALLTLFKDTFLIIKPLLDQLYMTPQAIKHFAGIVYKSTLPQMRKRKDVHQQCLLLAAFVQDQFYLRQDYAVDAFIKAMRHATNKGKKYDREMKEREEKELAEANSSILNTAKNSVQLLKVIIDTAKDENISLSERNEKVINLAESYFEAENPDLVSHIERLETSLANYDLRVNFSQSLFEQSDSLQRSYSPFIKVLAFDEENSNKALIEAIHYFVDKDSNISDETPTTFMSEKEKKVVYRDNGVPVITRYKVILFSAIEKAIRKKQLTLKYSYRYQASHTYMISDEQWLRRKYDFIRAAGLEKYADGEAVLNALGKSLTGTYEMVNEAYLKDENDKLTIDKHGNWKLKESEPDYDASKYIPGLLKESNPIMLYEILSEIDSYTNFADYFSHHLNKNSKSTLAKKYIFGCLMSLGTNLGHTDLARASKGLTEKQLRDTEKLWFTEKSLEKVNQVIGHMIRDLPIPTIYSNTDNSVHTSSDGKKVVVAVDSLLANYSFKYYGKEQGVTVNSFLDEKQSFFHVNVLSSSDREAAHMMDGLVNSEKSFFHEREGFIPDDSIKEDYEHIHSTDTHGYTEAMFAGLHFLDVSFAPRLAKLNSDNHAIYAYESKSLRKNTTHPLAPNSQINRNKILKNWDHILRLMATIKLEYCSASLIFRMLSATRPEGPVYQAIKEFGRLIKSKFILTYIHDEELRRSIQKQLNRVELGQKLASAVFYGRSQKFHVGTPEEMQRIVACKTILQNCIVLWNYFFLSDYYNSLTTKEEKRVASEMISSGSVIAWKHINMMGIFDFDHVAPKSFKSTIKQMLEIKLVD